MPIAGIMILTVSGGYQSQKWGCFPLTHYLGGDFDHGKTMRPVSHQQEPTARLLLLRARGCHQGRLFQRRRKRRLRRSRLKRNTKDVEAGGGKGSLPYSTFSPTAESFGVSAVEASGWSGAALR